MAAAMAALRCLCGGGGWSYVGIWRPLMATGEQVRLVWGDVHCERTMSGFEAMDLLLKEKVALRSARDGQALPETSGRAEERVSVLVNKLMPNQVVVVGEGLIGQAALSGKHMWIVHDNLSNSSCPDKSPSDIRQQYWAGIQTIVIVPLLPFGVVQLGSTRAIMEDQGLINYVSSLIGRLCGAPGFGRPVPCPETSAMKSLIQHSYSLLLTSVSHRGDSSTKLSAPWLPGHDSGSQQYPETSMPSSELQSSFYPAMPYPEHHVTYCEHNPGFLAHSPSNVAGTEDQVICTNDSTLSHTSDVKDIEGALLPLYQRLSAADARVDNHNVSAAAKEQDRSFARPTGEPGEPNEPHQSSKFVYGGAHSVDGRPRSVSSVNRRFQKISIKDKMRQDRVLQESDFASTPADRKGLNFRAFLSSLRSNCAGNANEAPEDCLEAATKNCSDAGLPTRAVSLHHTEGSDLFDVLRFQHEPMGSDIHSEEFPVCGSDLRTPDPCMSDQDCRPPVASLENEFTYSGFISEENPDQLLEAIVSKVRPGEQNQDTNAGSSTSVSCSPIHAGSHSSTVISRDMFRNLTHLAPGAVKMERNDILQVHASTFSECSTSVDSAAGCFQRHPGYKSQISLLVESSQSTTSDSLSAGSSKRGDESGKPGRKRARAGETPRPRPKDRQMIQDRIKELRDIVPDGAKCSIDALLEKTIKHMLFLQSVAKHADKLKEAGEPKIMSQDGGLLLKDNSEGGATWAFEVGTQSMTCPIIVEDLHAPRQMLVEMLCKERGIFLEIADHIRGMGLTILKGVMEVRKDKVWARFAVEANKDVTRMEIFLSLVRLLEPSAENPVLEKGLENISLPHSAFYSSSIPATGRSDYMR